MMSLTLCGPRSTLRPANTGADLYEKRLSDGYGGYAGYMTT